MAKCFNLRYMARIGEHHVVGRIGFDENGTIVLLHNGLEPWRGNSLEEIMKIYGMENFELVPRDPETYRDWQVGDTIKKPDAAYCQGRVIFVSGDFVAIESGGRCTCYTNEELFEDGYRLILTDIEQQLIEERKKYEPQDGDVCYAESKTGYNDVFIYKAGYRKTEYYVATNTIPTTGAVVADNFIAELRPATEEERQGLFDALKERGKRWNAERKVVEDIPKPYEFRKGEPVLVKDEGGKWCIGVFIQRENSFYGYRTRPADGIGEIGYRYCLPYNERTMHLLGTAEDYKEEQR